MFFSLRCIWRVNSSQLSPSSYHLNKLTKVLYCTSKDDSSSSDEEMETNTNIKKNQDAVDKLNSLLKLMSQEEYKAPASKINVQLTKPPTKPKKENAEETIANAAKKAAEVFGGNVKQTESELLNKLLNSALSTDNQNEQKPVKSSTNLKDLISGMKIDRTKKTREGSDEGRAQQVRRILESRGSASMRQHVAFNLLSTREVIEDRKGPRMYSDRVDIFGEKPLGIFKEPEIQEKSESEVVELNTWQRLQAREFRLTVTHPPANIYEEMIQWTNDGRLWHFPINNEQGMDEESKIYFTEHVFLEHHLDPWCPKKGPVRYFMELVCIGLSKNPWITAQMKVEHIEWFRNYFEGKKQILLETGSITEASEIKTKVEEESAQSK